MDVSIIIVNFNTRGLVRQCLKSIRRAAPALEYEVIVVDNGSADGSAAMIRSEFPEVRLIESGANIGFARGNNLAMRESKGRYVFILNPDAMLTGGALEAMAAFMDKNPDVAMLGAKLIHPDKTRQESAHRFPSIWTPAYRRTPLGRLPHARRELDKYFMRGEVGDGPVEVDWTEGAALFVRRKAVEAVGMLDERYFMYFEDTDWARRFWAAGWRVMYFPRAAVIHYHRRESADGSLFGSLANKVTWYHIASAMRYFWKWRGRPLPRS